MDLPSVVPPEIKRINHSRIFRFLYEMGAQSRKDIAQALHLSIPTVVQNLREMEEENLLCEAGVLASTGGRKAVAVCLNDCAKYAIGLDITQTHVGMVVLNLKGTVVYQNRVKSPYNLTQSYFAEIKSLVDGAISQLQLEPERILGVGISVPAIVSESADRLEYSAIIGYELTVAHFTALFPYPCRFCNDAKAACRAEQWISREQDDFIYLCLSNSVGGAIVQHGKLSEGKSRRSAEFGHMTIVPNGKPCYCGKFGCLDAYCNAQLLTRHADGNLGRFFVMVQKGEPSAVAEWDIYLEYLAIVVNNLHAVFDDAIVLGGYVGCYMQPYLEHLQSIVAQRNTFPDSGEFLRKCHFNQFEASAVGAALGYLTAFLDEV